MHDLWTKQDELSGLIKLVFSPRYLKMKEMVELLCLVRFYRRDRDLHAQNLLRV